jgi:hypothetical protein
MKKKNYLIAVILIIVSVTAIIFTMLYAKNNLNFNDSEFMGQNMNGQTPPDMPSENTESPFDKADTNMEEPPEKPDGESDDESNPKDKPNGENDSFGVDMQNKDDNNSYKLSYKYYIAFGIENFVLTISFIYLIVSVINKNNSINNDKKLIIVLLSFILTLGLTYFDTIIMNNSSSKPNNDLMDTNNSNASVSYSSTTKITEDTEISSGEYSSDLADENAILVSGDNNTTITDVNVEKTGDSDGGDNTSFYGINSAIIAKDGANLTLKNITVTTSATGANGVFSYGGSATTNNQASDGTTITISDSKITTTKDNSGGIMTTGGGKMYATNLTINTSGISSAAIRTDRGGGTVEVNKGTYTTTGAGSPTIYSTASVTVNNAKLISKVSEGIVVEGKNSVTINSCELTDSNTKLNGQSTTYKNIFLYQSMSGDAADGSSVFTANDSTITTNNGDTFYVTNTTARINLENNTITNNDSTGNFLRVQKDSWGNSGSNGGDVTLVMTSQNVSGNIVIDSISKLDMTMKSSSYYEGTINGDNTAKSISLTLDKSSKIKLTGDSYITSLNNSDSNNSNIDFNGFKLYVNGEAIN